jgi:polar amino acid transport system substrate-binding protein
LTKAVFVVKTSTGHVWDDGLVSSFRLILAAILVSLGSWAARAQEARPTFPWPHLRHVDPEFKPPENLPQRQLKLLAEGDFAPFTYKSADGRMIGISIDLAMAACARMNFTCEIVERPFTDLMPALLRKDGDVIVSGHRITKPLVLQFATTKPYYLSLGRFLIRSGSPLESADIRTLAGKRVGFVEGTTHGAFIEANYGKSVLAPMKTESLLYEALRTAAVDVAFTDSIRAAFWMRGSQSRNCCLALGGSYVDRTTFSTGLTFIMPKDRIDLQQAFDHALDQLERDGTTEAIFNRYVPTPLW